MKGQAARRCRQVAIGVTVLLCATCGPGHYGRGGGFDNLSGVSGTVLTTRDLAPFGTLADALRGRVPGLRMDRDRTCPALSLRRGSGPTALSAPTICVDGTRVAGTCALTELSVHDIARVEIYPVAAPRLPACLSGAHGMIRITTKPG